MSLLHVEYCSDIQMAMPTIVLSIEHFVRQPFFFLFFQTEVQLNVTREKLLASDLIHMIHTDRT